MNRKINFGFCLITLFCIVSCGTARRGEPIGDPLQLNEQQLRGQKVFMTYCNKCHPGGEAGLGPALSNKPVPGFTIRLQIRKGFGAMPAFKENVISDEQLDDLMAYINTLRKQDPEDVK